MIAAVMSAWNVGKSKAYQYMKEYGLTDSKYAPGHNSDVHQHIDDATDIIVDCIDDVVEHIDDAADRLDKTHQIIIDKLDMIAQQQTDNESTFYRYCREMKEREERIKMYKQLGIEPEQKAEQTTEQIDIDETVDEWVNNFIMQ